MKMMKIWQGSDNFYAVKDRIFLAAVYDHLALGGLRVQQQNFFS